MSLFDTISSLLGQGGGEGSTNSVPQTLLGALAEREGGLGGLVQQFENAGLGSAVSSWIGTGENQSIAPEDVHNVLGADVVQQIAAKTGLPVEQLLPQLAEHLPQLVNGMTPNGEVPSGSNLLDAGLAFLKSRTG
jgi:uncharacterized protein YidB (DUF937 family)